MRENNVNFYLNERFNKDHRYKGFTALCNAASLINNLPVHLLIIRTARVVSVISYLRIIRIHHQCNGAVSQQGNLTSLTFYRLLENFEVTLVNREQSGLFYYSFFSARPLFFSKMTKLARAS